MVHGRGQRVGYLPDALNITGLTIYEGHEKVETVVFPCLIVYAEGSSPHPDFPVEAGVRVTRLRCKFQVDSITDTRADLDAWKEALELAMLNDLEAIQDVLNKPVGTDTRTVQGIYFQHVEMSDDPSETSETDWIEDLIFNVTAEPLDS